MEDPGDALGSGIIDPSAVSPDKKRQKTERAMSEVDHDDVAVAEDATMDDDDDDGESLAALVSPFEKVKWSETLQSYWSSTGFPCKDKRGPLAPPPDYEHEEDTPLPEWTDPEFVRKNFDRMMMQEDKVCEHFYEISLEKTWALYSDLKGRGALPDDVEDHFDKIKEHVESEEHPPHDPPFPRALLLFSFLPRAMSRCPYFHLVPHRHPHTGQALRIAPDFGGMLRYFWLGNQEKDETFVWLCDELQSLVEKEPQDRFLTKEGRFRISQAMVKHAAKYLDKLSPHAILVALDIYRCYFWSLKLAEERDKIRKLIVSQCAEGRSPGVLLKKLYPIERDLSRRWQLPIEKWAEIPEEIRCDSQKLMERITSEHEQTKLRCRIELDRVEYLRCKRIVAEDIGIWEMRGSHEKLFRSLLERKLVDDVTPTALQRRRAARVKEFERLMEESFAVKETGWTWVEPIYDPEEDEKKHDDVKECLNPGMM